MKAAVVTISDGCHRGEREDNSGEALCKALAADGWTVTETGLVPDEIDEIQQCILGWTRRGEVSLIVSTGGTGLGPRDVTPEAVMPLLDKDAVGLAELIRLRGLEHTPLAALSRSVAGVVRKTLVLCLPGSPRGAVQSWQAVAEVIPHAVEIARGRTRHEVS